MLAAEQGFMGRNTHASCNGGPPGPALTLDICVDTCGRPLQASVPAGRGLPKGTAGRMAAEIGWSTRESDVVARDSGMNGLGLDRSG
jgi:hypothetical protein